MCTFNYESVHKRKHTFLVSDPHKTKCLRTCDELPKRCNSHKDQVLGVWVILT